MQGRTRDLTLITAAVATLATLAVSIVHLVEFSYTSRELRVSLETAQALVGFLVTHLLYGRFRRTGRRGDLVLVYGMGLLSAANLFFPVGLILGSRFEASAFQAWAPLTTRIVAGLAIATAAWMPRHQVAGRVAAALMLCLHVVSLLVITGTVVVVQDHLPLAVETSLPRAGIGRLGIEGHPVLEVAQIALMGLLWLAAAGFVRRADSEPGPLTTALAVGFVLAGFSRLSYFQDPSLYTDVIHFGDLLRLASYLVLLAGAVEEISLYWQGLSRAAVEEERRRTARDLHDGLVQELSFIRSRVSTLASGHIDGLVLEQISSAAERALSESRQAIDALSFASEDDLTVAIRRAAEEVATRAGARLRVDIPASLDIGPRVSEALSRIVREACSNAVRHGEAREIAVCLQTQQETGFRLTVSDDGRGFTLGEGTRRGGFGLTSMRQRAERLGGALHVLSAPGRGTTVEVIVPGHTEARRGNRGRGSGARQAPIQSAPHRRASSGRAHGHAQREGE